MKTTAVAVAAAAAAVSIFIPVRRYAVLRHYAHAERALSCAFARRRNANIFRDAHAYRVKDACINIIMCSVDDGGDGDDDAG